MQSQPKVLWFLTLAYVMFVILANWFDELMIHIAGFDINAGMLIFTCTFLFSAIITEIYGYKHARRAVWCGLIFSLLLIVYGQIVVHMPDPEYAKNNALFDSILATHFKFILAFIISYSISEFFNIIFLAKQKTKMWQNNISIRFALAIFIAALIDNILFWVIAPDAPDFVVMMSNMLFVNGIILLLTLPFAVSITKKIKKIEGMDIYDEGVNFKPFSLEVNYSVGNNRFKHMLKDEDGFPLSRE